MPTIYTDPFADMPYMNPDNLKASTLHRPGAKDDKDKPLVELVLGDFAHALEQVCQIGTFGAQKYTEHGWLSVPDAQKRYANAAGRHRLTRQKGETIDPESEMPHLAHEAWNILAQLELYLREEEDARQSKTMA